MKIDTSNFGSSNPSAAFSALLGNDNSRKTNAAEIPIADLIPYEDQPFRPYDHDDLVQLAEDIKLNGVLSPVLIRPYQDKYQILAGHNRTAAAQLAGLETVPCIIKSVDDDTATLIMTNTNLFQRQGLLPSEKAFAYLAQMQALKNKGISNTGAEVAAQNNDSRTNIFRYVRLTQLFAPMLSWVDSGTLPFRAGVNLSYLSAGSQELLYDIVLENDLKISLNQSDQIRSLAAEKNGEISEQQIKDILMKKPRPKEKKIKLEWNLISGFFPDPDSITEDDIENAIVNALRLYYNHEEAHAE